MTKNKEFMKNITRYATEAEYDQDFDNLDFPNVSYIDEGDEVRYMEEHPYIIKGKSTATSPFGLIINGTGRTVTLDTATGDWELNVKSYLPLTSLSSFAINKSNITECKFPKNFNTSNVTNMLQMFSGCSNLTTLDVSNFDTSNVTDMTFMFNGCRNLPTLDVSNWNTSNVTSMRVMFSFCSKLTSLDVSNWNTSNVTKMDSMFTFCSNLTSLDVSNWNTSNVTKMEQMFQNCSNLTSLDLSNFNTEKVTNMQSMFQNCSNLTSLDVSNFNTSNVTNIGGMFQNCSNLTSLDVSHFNTDKVTSVMNMFNTCSKLTSLDLSNFNTEKVTDMRYMFSGCSNLTTLKLCGIGDGTNGVDTGDMFRFCTKLANIPSCGDIHNTVNFSPCPLTLDSAKVVLNALSTPYEGAQTLTLSDSTKNLINADPEALALVEEKRAMGWTISL